jgi:lipopolysaccharide/colanic/teichoic acid biosynthesis glycosyltransferase
MTGKRATPRGIPRFLEAAIAGAGLLLLSPFIGLAAILVRASSSGPAFFRQERVGRDFRRFTLYKLRTMRASEGGPQVTARGDRRITPIGRLLRRSKVDELPQLWNVVRGDMGFVGPRPEVPRYVDSSNPLWSRVLGVRPGITDPVTLELRDEEAVIAGIEGDRERFYREELQPEKLRRYVDYLEARTAWKDVGVLCKTVLALVIPGLSVSPPKGGRETRRGDSSARV